MKNFFIILLIVPSLLLRGFVLMNLWSWFLVPLFGWQELTIAPAMVLSLVVGFFTSYVSVVKDEYQKDLVEKIILVFIFPLFYLLFGWVVNLFL